MRRIPVMQAVKTVSLNHKKARAVNQGNYQARSN